MESEKERVENHQFSKIGLMQTDALSVFVCMSEYMSSYHRPQGQVCLNRIVNCM